ncbi:MAG: deoxyribodipyrimidine photo-lyase, partial [Pseudomonadota bacterium]|nr:deoxyribodipyrimidine photo-lyase [Pseudomonadota bacterium]
MSLDPSRPEALRRIAAIDAEAYARTRNALDGAVTGLSPWITHGIVTPAEVLAGAIAAHRAAGRSTPIGLQHRLVMELGWREYFRHVWHHRGDAILHSLHEGVLPDGMYADAVPADVRQARTGVPVIDRAVRELHARGHLHNHARLWLASYLVHLRKVHWRAGADWLWPRLLDGDLASNHLSWQWVAATGSRKPYLFNAENIARHAPPEWHSPGSVLDTDHDSLERIARSPAPVRTRPRPDAEGCPEPALQAEPPDGGLAGIGAELHEQVRGREVWLAHPWALGDPPADLPAGTVVVGLLVAETHRARPWSAARWNFVMPRLRQLAPHCALAPLAQWRALLRDARRVHARDDPHLCPALEALATDLRPAPRLFPRIERPCDSFSQWWTRVGRELSHADAVLSLVAPVPGDPD